MSYEIDPILQLLNPANTQSFNRLLSHAIGINENIIYSSLISKYTYYTIAKPDSVSDGWFYCTIDDLWESTTLKEKAQTRAIKRLVEIGLIETKVQGVPPRRYFRITNNTGLLRNLIAEGEKISKKSNKKTGKTKECTDNNMNSQFLQKGEIDFSERAKLISPKGENQFLQKDEIDFSKRAKSLYNHNLNNHNSINQSEATMSQKEQAQTDTKLIDGLIDKKAKQMTYSEMLQTIGSGYCYEAESEEYFTSYNERDRDTDECSIPYSLATDKNAMTQALKFLFSYSYYINKITNEEKIEEINFLDSVIKAMTELMTQDTSKISGRIVKYYEIIDIVNNIVKNSSLMEWYGFFDCTDGFKQHLENVLARKRKNGEQILYPYAFLKSCIANYLLDYKVYGTMDEMTANGIFRKEYGHDINSNGFNSDKYDCCVNAFDDTEKTTVPEESNTPVQSEETIQEVQSESADISAIQADNQEIQEHSDQLTVNIDEFLARLKGETDEQKKRIEEQNKQTRLKNALFLKQMYDEQGEPLPKHIEETLSEYDPEYIAKVLAELT